MYGNEMCKAKLAKYSHKSTTVEESSSTTASVANTVSPNHVVCDVNFWYHRQLNHQQEASPRNFNQS